MSDADARDPRPLLAIVAVAAGYVVVNHVGRWLAAVAALARSPLVPVLAGSVVGGLVALLLARGVVVRRVLAGRRRFVLVPADGFDPGEEAVVRFAAGLVRCRRLLWGLLDGRACAVRVRLDADERRRLRYAVEVPAHAVQALRHGLGSFDGVQLREAPERHEPAGVRTARAELVLARASVEPLRAAGLDPDPLSGFARALGDLDPARGEGGVVCVDLLPVTAARRRALRRRLLRSVRREHRNEQRFREMLSGPAPRYSHDPVERVERRAELRALTSKLGSPEPMFEVQVLVQVSSPWVERTRIGVHGLIGCFDVLAGENHFRAAGMRLPGGATFLGANAPWRRRRFDRRLRTGLFAPARRRVVTASEVAGFLKPPTKRCPARNVLRSGGMVGEAPERLPEFHGQRNVIPLGRVIGEHGPRTVGVPLEGTFFSYTAGRSRYGKTETAIGQFVHLVRSGHGGFFLDPHEDAIERIKAHLTDEGLRERVIEIDLATRTDRQPGWNLLATHGRPPHEQVDAVVDAFASTLGWDETNTRALNLTTQAAQALIELARSLPRESAPTIFQVPTLLGDEEWRRLALPYLSPATRQFFTERFPRLSPEAITPVTNLIDRLRAAPPVAALLGNPASGYDVRAAMDEGMIVLACPGSGSVRDRLVANFLVYDVLHAAKTRASLDPQRRRPFYVFLDEVQTYDGATSGNLAALLEQTAKYGIRAFLFNQNPERLTPATLNAITTNRSHLMTTALNAKAAGLLTREWGGTVEPETVTNLHRYTFLASVTLDGEPTPPFLLHGVPADELHPPTGDPHKLAALEDAIDQASGRAAVTDTLARLDGHDERIRAHLAAMAGPAVAGPLSSGPDRLAGETRR